MELKEIVPEYGSKNFLLRNLFLKRLRVALELAQLSLKLESKNNLNLIDLGCGDGTMLKIVEEKFKTIRTFGIDIEPNIVKLKKFLRAQIKIADIRRSGFPDNFFDIAFCLDVLEHFKNLKEPIMEIKRILKPNALFIISSPTENLFYKTGRFLTKGTISEKKGPYCGFNFSPHFYKADQIEDILCSKRFEAIRKKRLPIFPTLFYIIAFKNKK